MSLRQRSGVAETWRGSTYMGTVRARPLSDDSECWCRRGLGLSSVASLSTGGMMALCFWIDSLNLCCGKARSAVMRFISRTVPSMGTSGSLPYGLG